MGRHDGRRQGGKDERSEASLAMRITDQFRQKGSMMYDLKGGTLRLTLRICQRTEDWEIEAIPRQLPELHSLTATAPSRCDALQLVADAWGGAIGFPSVDWGQIRNALTIVRAI
jgi:hypothetical protein